MLDLFSGIGGFSLGLERAGPFRTTQFCEIDPFCRRVLARHWPGVPIHDDVRTLHGALGQFDVLCGGFPCQDISLAGKGAGLGGARSGLWTEYVRLIGEIRPRWAIIENVPALRSRGLDQVLGALAALGYDAEWHCVPAAAVGAPHRRDRVWVVAHPGRNRGEQEPGHFPGQASETTLGARRWMQSEPCNGGADVADANGAGPHASTQPGIYQGEAGAGPRDGEPERLRGACAPGSVADAHRNHEQRRPGDVQMGRLRFPGQAALDGDAGRTQWAVEPDVGRVADGVPDRVDRLRALGNAVVPQVVQLIGHAIYAHEIFN